MYCTSVDVGFWSIQKAWSRLKPVFKGVKFLNRSPLTSPGRALYDAAFQSYGQLSVSDNSQHYQGIGTGFQEEATPANQFRLIPPGSALSCKCMVVHFSLW